MLIKIGIQVGMYPEIKYALEHGYINFRFYIDDGISGTTFNRPGFHRRVLKKGGL